MGERLSLNNICTDESVSVLSIETESAMKRRLYDMGMTEGTTVKCVGKSPLGDPAAYVIRGAVIALRNCDCENIIVYRVEGE